MIKTSFNMLRDCFFGREGNFAPSCFFLSPFYFDCITQLKIRDRRYNELGQASLSSSMIRITTD